MSELPAVPPRPAPPMPAVPPTPAVSQPSPASPEEPYVATAELLVQWAPHPTADEIDAAREEARRVVGPWALGAGILALLVALFVGWGFPIGFAGVIGAIIALRRPTESRPVAVWALSLSIASLVFSAGWLAWAASVGGLFG